MKTLTTRPARPDKLGPNFPSIRQIKIILIFPQFSGVSGNNFSTCRCFTMLFGKDNVFKTSAQIRPYIQFYASWNSLIRQFLFKCEIKKTSSGCELRFRNGPITITDNLFAQLLTTLRCIKIRIFPILTQVK